MKTSIVSEQVSQCCGAAVTVESDGHPSLPFVTSFYVCTNCGNECDVKPNDEVSGE